MKDFWSFFDLRFPNGIPSCPRCHDWNIALLTTRMVMKCRTCKTQFSPTSNTYYHSNKLPFTKAHHLHQDLLKKEQSSLSLMKVHHVQYNTIWLKAHQLSTSSLNIDSS